MKMFFILCVALFVITSGCETREQIMQEREGDKLAGSLEAAAYMAEVDNIRRLVAEKADVNVKFKDGGTPLFSAIQRIPAERNNRRLIQRRREAIRVLLDAGANPNVERNGKRLIETAKEGGDGEINRMLEEAAASRTGL
ncbi:MAG: ankyrin repeat domain-containing protein [Acidobacteria bacterium]|jgi:ankyrin repeat protein|nr:ankyrin repeat domain-containing protein [Acidobacteriota bacterium]MBA4124152.1 ankyrin repeat domain-containing protein [Acidobacteriota bacterium]MBA4184948.1 ankyrin repeat domain-containing protein [Acidobacteriota bacterium]HEV8159374.1 ankyrin repeat domain-containing protein [Pyrinomonadaceae bacterium]